MDKHTTIDWFRFNQSIEVTNGDKKFTIENVNVAEALGLADDLICSVRVALDEQVEKEKGIDWLAEANSLTIIKKEKEIK